MDCGRGRVGGLNFFLAILNVLWFFPLILALYILVVSAFLIRPRRKLFSMPQEKTKSNKMEEQILGILKDCVAFTCGFSLAMNLLPVDSTVITGCFALTGIVLGRILDWSWETYKKRRDKRKPRKKLLP